MTLPYLINEFVAMLAEQVAHLLLRATAGGPVQLPQSNEDFALF